MCQCSIVNFLRSHNCNYRLLVLVVTPQTGLNLFVKFIQRNFIKSQLSSENIDIIQTTLSPPQPSEHTFLLVSNDEYAHHKDRGSLSNHYNNFHSQLKIAQMVRTESFFCFFWYIAAICHFYCDICRIVNCRAIEIVHITCIYKQYII